ncbi:spermatogenesis associated 2-like [Neosynchiropus ocellatus]
MSGEQRAARGLVEAYSQSLRRQVRTRGSHLACSDEDLRDQVTALLSEDPREAHCLGLDPLGTMEESLQVVSSTRRGLVTLERAFQVLEQAALNLYVAPWREEYQAVKVGVGVFRSGVGLRRSRVRSVPQMYSGVFTHVLKPALCGAQIHLLFGLLGYEPPPTQREPQQLLRVRSASCEELLRLSCAFFLARCECRLLLETLGNRSGDAMWQLGIVRERRRGRTLQVGPALTAPGGGSETSLFWSLQASLDSVRSTLAEQRVAYGGESDVDLYTDQAVNGDHRHLAVPAEAGPHSLAWEALRTPGAQGSLAEPQVCVSTLSYQLTGPPSLNPRGSVSPESGSARASGAAPVGGAPGDAPCACLQTPVYVRECAECGRLHDVSCVALGRCGSLGHRLLSPGRPADALTRQSVRESGPLSPRCSSAALSSLTLSDDGAASRASRPISFHACCGAARPDPRHMCVNCHVFHRGPCPQLRVCLAEHEVRSLVACGCGKICLRKPLVLCVYCGAEYCSDCWYKNPLHCACGRPLDPPASV